MWWGWELPICSRTVCWRRLLAWRLAGRGGSAGNLAMAVWSALGFLFLPRNQSCTRSKPHQSRPQQDASSSLTTKT